MFSIKTLQTIMCSPGIGGRRGLRALFWGKPGVGKTAQLEGLVQAMGALSIVIIASIREPSDFLGIPMPDGKGGMAYAPPAWAVQANAAAKSEQLVVVIIDEITTCPPAVQGALLRVVNEGYVGDLKLHENVAFIAAANPAEYAAGGYDLSPPMANRWMHLQWLDPTPSDFSEGILSDWAATTQAESAKKVMQRIDSHYDVELAQAKGLVTGFLKANGSHLVDMPKEGNPDRNRAWPSLRTWELAIRTIAGSRANGLSDVEQDDLIEGCVGRAVAGELRQYQAAADLPNPAELLDAKDPSTVWEHNPERPDITVAVFNSCAALVTPPNAQNRKERADKFWEIIGGVTKSAADVAVIAGRAVAKAGLSGSPVARKTMVKFGTVMHAMGGL